LSVGDGQQYSFNGNILIVTTLKITAAVFKRHRRKAGTSEVLYRKGTIPQFIWRRKANLLTLNTGIHINTVNTLPIVGIAKTNRQFTGIIFGLTDALGQWLIPSFGFNHRQLGIAIFQHIVGS